MEVSKFIKESVRMCSQYDCGKCPAGGFPCITDVNGLTDDDKVLEKYIATVEKWSAEHPVITNEDKMVEIFGDETVNFLEAYLRFVCADGDFKKRSLSMAWRGV